MLEIVLLSLTCAGLSSGIKGEAMVFGGQVFFNE